MRSLAIILTLPIALGLSACLERSAPADRIVSVIQGKTINLVAEPISNSSEIVMLKTIDSEARFTPERNIIRAERASIISQSTLMPDGTSVSNNSYNIQYHQTILNPKTIQGAVSFINSSDRGFDLTNTIIRLESNNSAINISYPQDITNKKRLAPEELLVLTFTIQNAELLNNGDTVIAKIYELPKSISPSGEIVERSSATTPFKVSIKLSDEEDVLYWAQEARTYSGTGDDPTLIKYLR